jgi:hypothetical protein
MRLLLVLACLMIVSTVTHKPKSQTMTNAESSNSSQEVQSLKNDVHVLENTLQISRNLQDRWNGWYMGLGVAAIFLAILSWSCQKKASSIELSSRPTADALSDKNAQLRDLLDKAAQVEVSKAQKDASEATTRSGKAELSAAKAQESLAGAEARAAEANAKAESFRLEIARANESSEQAKAQVAGAVAEAAKANLELARIKAPRNLTISPDWATELQKYPGTEYTFSMVSTDPESIDLLRKIDKVLSGVGWKRVKPDPPAVIGANVFDDDKDFRVIVGSLKGIKIEVGCAMDASDLQLLAPETWPMAVKLAGGLRNFLDAAIVPDSPDNIQPSVGILKGSSEVVRISVGSKP